MRDGEYMCLKHGDVGVLLSWSYNDSFDVVRIYDGCWNIK